MNQVNSLGVGMMPVNEIAGTGGGLMYLWPVLGFILVGGILVLMVYKKFFE